MKKIKNKTVLITGGARGIGRKIALEFAKHGADIIICDLDKSFFEKNNFKTNVKDIEDLGVSCFGYYLDVTKYDDIIKTRESILKDIGKIHILVNNAGVVFGGKFLEIPIEKHRITYDVNTQGIINILHVFLQDLIDQKSAHIINIASASGFTPLPNGTTYASSKAAVISFSESLINELKQNNNKHVGMTIVCPAYVNTGMFNGVKEPIFIPMLTPEKLAKKIIRAVYKNKRFVLEPAFIKFIPILKALTPHFVFDFLGRILGGYSSMEFWKGRTNK
jgi:short-subunit dehydrogenase